MRRLWKWCLALVVAGSLVVFLSTRDQIPNPIRLCAGTESGFNHHLAEKLAERLRAKGIPAVLLDSRGSRSNRQLLLSGQADLAVLKFGSVELDELEVLAPIYPDVMMVVVRRDRGIKSIADLKGKNVILGRAGSGTREVARSILEHYRVDPRSLGENARYFGDLATEPSIDAAFISTALTNPDLKPILGTGQFDILPLQDAGALCVLFPYFHETTVPLGLFRQDPPLPGQAIPTVATTALLVGTKKSSPRMIAATLAALYEYHMLLEFPTLFTKGEAAQWSSTPLHEAARDYFDPYRGLGTAANFLESISAIKELFVGLLALLWLLWERYRRKQEHARSAEVSRLKERLDVFIEMAVALERKALAAGDDASALERLFRETSKVKLDALDELTHEELRGDRNFSILMTQCTDLMELILNLRRQPIADQAELTS